MKAQYVGDIGDFGKVLVLKHVAGLGFKIGINWVLTENDNRGDGKHRDYIDYCGRDCLCNCDGKVFEQMLPLAKKEKSDRKIDDLESLIRSFSESIVFYSKKYVGGEARRTCEDKAFAELSSDKADLVFFDPDNGVAAEKGNSSKYVYLSDLKWYWGRKQSLLTYHHLGRAGTHEKQVQNIRSEFHKAFAGGRIYTYHLRRGSARLYVLCVRGEHLRKIFGKDTISALEPLEMKKETWAKRGNSCDKNHSAKTTPAAQPPPPSRRAMLDAATSSMGHTVKVSKNPTTTIGYVNRNGQVVIRNTGLRGTDHGQSVYQLGCSLCSHVYGVNGSDIHLRKCPNCQSGKPGLPME